MGENRCTKGRCQSLNMVVFFEALQVLWLLAEGALNADCNGKLYDDEIDICCDGHVVYGGAVGQWGCCGAGPYLLSRELCCNGTIYNVYHVEATNIRCCGSLSLDTTDGVCCNNEVLRGQTHCPYSVAEKEMSLEKDILQ